MKINIKLTNGEFRVPGPKRSEAEAYYTNDREDAINTAYAMHGSEILITINCKPVI